jgi:hypothetical protein
MRLAAPLVLSAAPQLEWQTGLQITPHDIIKRLLQRTERSIIARGIVMVDDGPWWSPTRGMHVLVASIFDCALNNWLGMAERDAICARALMLIGSAEADGSGLDLTGGVTMRKERFRTDLWPEGKFDGVLHIVDRLVRTRSCLWTSASYGRLELMMRALVPAMQRVRVYRMWMPGEVAFALESAGITMQELHAVVKTYLLLDLHDASRLDHPILTVPLPWG